MTLADSLSPMPFLRPIESIKKIRKKLYKKLEGIKQQKTKIQQQASRKVTKIGYC